MNHTTYLLRYSKGFTMFNVVTCKPVPVTETQ